MPIQLTFKRLAVCVCAATKLKIHRSIPVWNIVTLSTSGINPKSGLRLLFIQLLCQIFHILHRFSAGLLNLFPSSNFMENSITTSFPSHHNAHSSRMSHSYLIGYDEQRVVLSYLTAPSSFSRLSLLDKFFFATQENLNFLHALWTAIYRLCDIRRAIFPRSRFTLLWLRFIKSFSAMNGRD